MTPQAFPNWRSENLSPLRSNDQRIGRIVRSLWRHFRSAVRGSTDAFYQTPLGADFGWTINAAILPFFPEIHYDSWFTIGATDNSVPSLASSIGLDSGLASFNGGGDFVVDDEIGGSVFTLLNDDNAIAGADLRVLIAQLTTAGELYGSINVQMFVEGFQNQSMQALAMPIQLPQGCGDVEACNYDPTFSPEDTAECTYPDTCSDCNGACIDAVPMACRCDEFSRPTHWRTTTMRELLQTTAVASSAAACTSRQRISILKPRTTTSRVFSQDAPMHSAQLRPCRARRRQLFVPRLHGPIGLNFDSVANVSGACEYSAVCMSDLDGDGYVDVFDLLLMFEAYGYDCE